MSEAVPHKRLACAHCLRPAATCLCPLVAEVCTRVEVLILQHPLEERCAKGSARLLHLCLGKSRLVIGEMFDAAELQSLLYSGQRQPILLFPDTADERALGMASAPALEGALLHHPESLRLVVLDGTWRKSRKMLYLNPLLQRLPRLSLTGTAGSRYTIRQAHAADQLSTLEACCHALGQVEGDPARFAPILHAFEQFVEAYRLHLPPGARASASTA